MSTLTNIPINARSMNGIIVLSDGTATISGGNLTTTGDITGDNITSNSFSTNDITLNGSLEVPLANDISITNTGGTYLVSIWNKGRSYLQQDVHANRIYSYNSYPVGAYEVANKAYVDRKTPSFATYSTSTLLPNTLEAPTMIQLNYVGYMYLTLPNVTSQYIGREYTVYLGYPLQNDNQVISVTGRSASQLIQRKDGTITYLVDFNNKGVNSYTFVCCSLTPSTTTACWMISNSNYELENVFLNNRMANQYNENYVENNWHKLNYFDRPEAEGSALSLAIGSVFELNGNIYTGGRTLTPEDLSYPASSRQKITLVGNYLATNLTFLDAGLCPIDDGLPSPPTQVYLPEIIDSNDFGKHFSFYLNIGTGLQVEILTTNFQQITYLNQTGLTSVFLNPTGQKTNILTFYAIKDGSTDNWFLTDNQINLPLSDNTFSGHNYFSGEVDFQNTINANSLTITPTQLSFLNQVVSNQIPSTAISGAGFLTETSNPNITGIFSFLTNPVFNTGGIALASINGSANITLDNTASTFSAVKTFTANISANSLTITPTQLSFLNQVASNKIPVTAVNANLLTTDTAQSITATGIKTFLGNIVANSLTITPTQLSFLNQVASNKIPVTAVNANLLTTDTAQSITATGIKTFLGNIVANSLTITPTQLSFLNQVVSNEIPTAAVQDCGTRYPSTARALTFYSYLAGNAMLTTTTTGTNCVAVGDRALQTNSSGSFNTAVGSLAGNLHDSGNSSTYVGYASGQANTASNCTVVGAGSCNTQASLANCTSVGAANQITTGVSNAFVFGYNSTCTANGAGVIGNNINNVTSNQIEIGAGINTVFINGQFVTNNQYLNEAGPVITAAITLPNTYFYSIYGIRNGATAFTIRMPTATAARVGTTIEFRRVLSSVITTVISFDCATGTVMFAASSVTAAATITMASGTVRTKMTCLSDGQATPAFGWYVSY